MKALDVYYNTFNSEPVCTLIGYGDTLEECVEWVNTKLEEAGFNLDKVKVLPSNVFA